MKKGIEWQLFPKSLTCPTHLKEVIDVFSSKIDSIDSTSHKKLESNAVLAFLADGLTSIGYDVEKSKKAEDKIEIPVLFGKNGKLEKSFDADAYSRELKTVIEVEAGRAVVNYQFLKDLFEACVMTDVDYCVIAVRRIYRKAEDFAKVATFMDTLYSSNRLSLPLKGVLIIGY